MSEGSVTAEAAFNPLCPLDGRQMRPWLSVPIDGERRVPNLFSEVYRCDCRYGTVWPKPTAAEVAEFYPTDYYTHGGASLSNENPTFLDRLRVHIAWRLERDRPQEEGEWYRQALNPEYDTVCDIGCGSGQIANYLANYAYEVIGVDPDPKALALLRNGAVGLQGTAENLPSELRGRHFDVVTLRHSLEHCINPEMAVRNIRGLLRDDGMFICEVPNNEALALRFSGPAWAMLDVPRHLNFFTARTLQALLKRSGFTVVDTEYAFYARQFSNETIANEIRLREAIGIGSRNSKARAWALLALTALAPARFKYDSVRVVALATPPSKN